MARPAMSVDVTAKNLTKEEIALRKESEAKLRGKSDKIKPPAYLNSNAKKIFNYIVKEMEESGILSNLDIYVLAICATSLDRIQEAERLLNEDMFNKNARIVKSDYTKEFFRCCNELSLSPQARAKIGNINVQAAKEAEDPLLKALRGESVDE